MARRNRNLFNMTRSLAPGRSAFNLSERVMLDVNIGALYPVWFREVYPGDIIKYAAQEIVRFGAMSCPAFVGLNAKVELFFMPTRNLMGVEFNKYFRDMDTPPDFSSENTWEQFITGGFDGQYLPNSETAATLPVWKTPNTAKYSLWDYFGLPVGVDPGDVLDFPRRMYNVVWNEYYRNENVQDLIGPDNQTILNRNWKKDYFTSALPFQQRGVAPALPVNISGFAGVIPNNIRTFTNGDVPEDIKSPYVVLYSDRYSGVDNADIYFNSSNQGTNSGAWYPPISPTTTPGVSPIPAGIMMNLRVPGQEFDSTSVDITDLRQAFQIQKWMERNARGGVRYTEFMRAHFGVSPADGMLDRPYYLGSVSTPIVVSEVLQTSETTAESPQGNLAGHGLGAGAGFVSSFRVPEYGYMMALFSIVPNRILYSQGVRRELRRKTVYDYYSPEFAHLSEQAIEQEELFASTNATENAKVFGFQGSFNELRCGIDHVCGSFRDTLHDWSFDRQFDTAPLLNNDFVSVDSENDDLNRIFQVQEQAGESVPNILVDFQNVVKAIRPMPYLPEPGLIDHF